MTDDVVLRDMEERLVRLKRKVRAHLHTALFSPFLAVASCAHKKTRKQENKKEDILIYTFPKEPSSFHSSST
jgi:hypothetical protein